MMEAQNKTEVFRCTMCSIVMESKVSWETHIQGKKHKKIQEWFNKKQQNETCGIFVRGFPNWSTPDQMKEYFSQFGKITEFIPGRTHTPFVIVQFMKRESAQFCLSRPLFYHGWVLNIRPRRSHVVSPPVRKLPGIEDKKKAIKDEQIVSNALSSSTFQEQLAKLIQDLQPADTAKFAVICRSLEGTFSGSYRGCQAHPYGSTVTGLAFNECDMDIYMDLKFPGSTSHEMSSSIVNKAKKLLYQSHGLYSHIFAIPKAKTPIVTFVHTPTNTRCDISFKNALGVNNSALIKCYLSLDERLKPLLIIIKYWAKKNELSGSGKISHYALAMMVLFYLQQLSPPVVPTVYSIRSNDVIIEGWECSINANAWNPGEERNTLTIPELVTGFLNFYSVFDYGLKVICPLTGESIAKSLFQVPEQLPKAMDLYKSMISEDCQPFKVDRDMCVQDPYELNHNITAGMSLKRLEMFKAYCGEAARICSEVLSTPEGDSTFLKKLFDKLDIAPMKLETLIKIPFRKIPNCGIIEEDKLRRWWFKSVFDFLINKVFEQILKCDVQVEEQEESDGQRKRLKLEGQTDVGTDEFNIPTSEICSDIKKIHCCGKFNFWEGRKGAVKKVNFPADVDPVRKEIILSDFMMEMQKEVTVDSDIKFTCVFRPELNPTQVQLEVINDSCSKGVFVSIFTFLKIRLQRLIETGLSDVDTTESSTGNIISETVE